MLTASRSAFVCLRCRSRLQRIPLRSQVFPRPFSHSPSVYRDLQRATLPSVRERSNNEYALPDETVTSMASDLTDFESSEQVKTVLSNPKRWGNPNVPEYIAVPQKAPSTWGSTHMRQAVADTIVRAFPDASRTTEIQRRLMLALTSGCSVVVREKPGSGKSFAITAWLLTLERAIRPKTVDGEKRPRLTTTALVLVPDMGLAEQYHSVLSELLRATGSKALTSSPDAFVQRLFRTSPKEAEDAQIELLKKHPNPHILIATPTILLDYLSHEDPMVRDLVDYDNLKAIIIEESEVALSRDNKNKPTDKPTPQEPLLILLDHIFKARKANKIKNRLPLTQPQLVLPLSARSPKKIMVQIEKSHPSWLDCENRPGFKPFTGKGRKSAAGTLLVVSDPSMPMAPRLPDSISHHVVAYDRTSGFLRDAPLPTFDTRSDALDAIMEQASREGTKIQEEDEEADFEESAPLQKQRGYPPEISAEVLEQLLEHDNWPRNVLVAVGESTSKPQFIAECAARGIDAEQLTFKSWNATAEQDGRFPIGRTDKMVGAPPPPAPSQKQEAEEEEEGGRRKNTKVWVSNYYSLRGLDVPDVSHLYIFHRLHRYTEYISYSGRVARWPFNPEEEARDHRAVGRDRRPRGKVVSVLLEEHVTPTAEEYEEEVQDFPVIRVDGSEREKLAWLDETVKLLKLGARAKPYFGEGGGVQAPQAEDSDIFLEDDGDEGQGEKRNSNKYKRHLNKRKPGFVPETRAPPPPWDKGMRRRQLVGWAKSMQGQREKKRDQRKERTGKAREKEE